MTDVEQVLEDFRTFRGELVDRFDSIDNVMEQIRAEAAAGRVEAATVDQLASELAAARGQVAAVDPEDPSGDDAPAAPTA